MKISFFIPYFGDGGVERTTLLMSKELVSRGHHVDIVTLRPWGPFIDQVPAGVRLIDLQVNRTASALIPFARYIGREGPEGIISAQHYANVVAVAASRLSRTGARVIVTERLALSEALKRPRNMQERFMTYFIRVAYPRAHAVVANSLAGARDLAQLMGWRPERVHTIYNPTFDDSILDRARDPLDHPWFKQGAPPVVVAAGRLTFQKDFQTLLRAFATVRRRFPCRLLIIGDGEDREQLMQLARMLGVSEDVALPGFVENPYPFMGQAALFVLSSRYEGMPNALIEAVVLGVPVVSTDCPTGPREILLGGAGGTLVPVGEPERMADAISQALENRQAALSLASVAKRAADRFRPARCASAYIDLLTG